MLPPTARTLRLRAAQVVMRASGDAIIATVAEGTISPPSPMPATVPKAITVRSFSGVTTAIAPPKQVNIALAMNRIHLLPPFQVLSMELKTMAPMVTLRPGAKPRSPTWTGSGVQTVAIMRGQKLSTEEKVHPGHKSDGVCERDNSLPLEKFHWHHRMFCSFPFPTNPSDDHNKSDEERAEHVGTCPRMSVPACLKSDQE